MAKIFEYKAGSYIDPISKTVGTPTNVTHRQTEKGVASEVGNNKYITQPSSILPSGAFTVVVWSKLKPEFVVGTDRAGFIANTTTGLKAICPSYNVILGKSILSLSSSNYRVFDYTPDKNWHCYVFTYPDSTDAGISSSTLKVDGVNIATYNTSAGSQDARSSFIYIGGGNNSSSQQEVALIRVYDTVLSSLAQSKEYEEFLQASPTEKEIRGFEYPNPTDLSYLKDTGLVAAYNMIPNGNTLVDISGNGNELALTNITTTKEGINFNGAGNASRATSYDLGTVQTIAFRGSVNSPALDGIISDGTNYLRISSATSFTSFFGGGANNFTIPALSNNTLYSFVFVRNGTNCRLYIDGSLVGEYTSTGNNSLGLRYIGSVAASSQHWSNEMTDMRIYNYAFTPEQAKAYHNSFVKPVLLEDFSRNPVNSTLPKGWIAGTGAYKISESVDKGKYLECITAGSLVIPSKQAYGTWEFDWFKGADINLIEFTFISGDTTVRTSGATNKYGIILATNEDVYLTKDFNTYLTRSATSYFANNTWYRMKITRTTAGVFTTLIKGGNFTPTAGYDGWTLVSVTGGNGANPATDTTYATSNYMILNIRAGDRISNIKLLDGIIQ